jgi:uncharacterized membrane protein YebE (DUF533 family)
MMENKYVTTGQAAAGGFLVWISGLDLASWSYIVGIFVALVGLLGGAYWQWRKDKRDAEKSRMDLEVQRAILESIKLRGVIIQDEHVV